MPELDRLRLHHGPQLLAFERANRGYFAASIPDRGDDDNTGSRIVLERTGFVVTGEITVDGRPGLRYGRDLDPSASVQ